MPVLSVRPAAAGYEPEVPEQDEPASSTPAAAALPTNQQAEPQPVGEAEVAEATPSVAHIVGETVQSIGGREQTKEDLEASAELAAEEQEPLQLRQEQEQTEHEPVLAVAAAGNEPGLTEPGTNAGRSEEAEPQPTELAVQPHPAQHAEVPAQKETHHFQYQYEPAEVAAQEGEAQAGQAVLQLEPPADASEYFGQEQEQEQQQEWQQPAVPLLQPGEVWAAAGGEPEAPVPAGGAEAAYTAAAYTEAAYTEAAYSGVANTEAAYLDQQTYPEQMYAEQTSAEQTESEQTPSDTSAAPPTS
jgi:hypothetical protein